MSDLVRTSYSLLILKTGESVYALKSEFEGYWWDRVSNFGKANRVYSAEMLGCKSMENLSRNMICSTKLFCEIC